MNLASLATFCLYHSERRGKPTHVIVAIDDATASVAADFVRMIRVWSWITTVKTDTRPLYEILADDVPPGERTIVTLAAEAQALAAEHKCGSVVCPKTPDLDDPIFGFFQEMEAHDYEIGGVNEWDESVDCIYSRFVLQSFSQVHIRRFFPHYAWGDISKIRPSQGTILRCLDIGCGPISKLRWGALAGFLFIVGVDPLNDIYDSIIARHGLDRLPKIRPDESISGFAEELDPNFAKFDFIFSMNALDHTQDLSKAIHAIISALQPTGAALINVYTREGERNSYAGLHKFNIWSEAGEVYYNTKTTAPALLREAHPSAVVEKIYAATPLNLSFLMRRKDQVS